MHDVLQKNLIADPNDPHELDIIQVKNMYTDYTNVSIDEVLASNRWH
jgi:hypothetical protein